jgi:hypothetical protein
VRHLDHSAADVQPGASEPFDAEQFKAYASTNDINNRVQSTDLVKVYAFDLHIVDARFCFRQSREDVSCTIFNFTI